ncbi:MAG: hypothetical protein KDC24_07890 [Saprospiraceae bacterium]|nr:hypothetical protein [Saprospiraceae bacterium]
MKKDIPFHKVEDLALAIAPKEQVADEGDLWDVFLLNFKEEPIKDVLIHSRGYGEIEGEDRKTSQFRFYFEKIAGQSATTVEQIQPDVFGMTNEYWISFVHDGYMYDKKYVFVKGSIDPQHFTTVPLINKKGVMIK